MRALVLAILAAVALGVGGCTNGATDQPGAATPATPGPAPADPIERAQRSVVLVSWGGSAHTAGAVLSADGLILTRQPAAEMEADTVAVNLGERTHQATVLAGDPRSRLAILHLDATTGLTPAEFADTDRVAVGDKVRLLVPPGVVAGAPSPPEAPAEAHPEPPAGQVRVVGRVVNGMSLIETDPLMPSGVEALAAAGGLLVNADGQVIGIAVGTAIGGDSGAQAASLALPGNTAVRIAEQLLEHGRARHPYLGVMLAPVNDGGARVEQVAPGSPAEQAGLRAGDVIEQAGDFSVTGPGNLVYAVQSRDVNDVLLISFRRDGATNQTEVVLGEIADQ